MLKTMHGLVRTSSKVPLGFLVLMVAIICVSIIDRLFTGKKIIFEQETMSTCFFSYYNSNTKNTFKIVIYEVSKFVFLLHI